MDPIAQLDALMPLLDTLVAGLDDADLRAATPCDEFDVRGVLQHMIGGATMFAAAFRGTTPSAVPDVDLIAAFAPAMADLGAAINAPGALERTIDAPFGQVTGETFARFVALDGLVHGWDIATATGQTYDQPVAVVAAVEAFAHDAIGDGMRDGSTFKAAIVPPDDASPLERVVAFTGRRVR